jgi:hypothetical protein
MRRVEACGDEGAAAAEADRGPSSGAPTAHAFVRTLGSIRHAGYHGPRHGAVAEWLGRGLQSLVQRFESARRLCRSVLQGFFFGLSGSFFRATLSLIHRLDCERDIFEN